MTLTSSIPVLRVKDYVEAREFWNSVLGFEIMEEAGEPATGFGIFRRDRAEVFLTAWDGPEAPYKGWRAYYHTDDLDGLVEDLKTADATFKGPVLTEYGMREVEVTDPSGNTVCFGADP